MSVVHKPLSLYFYYISSNKLRHATKEEAVEREGPEQNSKEDIIKYN